jgi:methyl-accepting chemotaxis protein
LKLPSLPILQRLTLGQKLFAIFGLVMCFASAQSFYALYELRETNKQTHELQVKWLPAVTFASDMNTHFANYRIAQMGHVFAATDEAKAASTKDMASAMEQFTEGHTEFVKHINTDDQRALHETFNQLFKQYMGLTERLAKLEAEKKTDEANLFLGTEMRTVFDKASTTLVTLVQINKFGAQQANEVSDNLYTMAVKVLAGTGALMMVLCGVIAWRFSRSVSLRVQHANTTLQAMAAGVLDRNVQTATPLALPQGHDEVGQLLGSLDSLNGTLRSIVRGVRHNAEAVAEASTRMLEDSSDLSVRSEIRAEAITETSATMEQLGVTVSLNADNAKEANRLASGASQLASAGGAVVGEVVSTMKGINESSRRIADIIGVIDSIAFQTNILALNAAVEAARAGDQGRGFAVVATEVRSLAQRSAAAAREIKTLINASVDRVGHGSKLVDQAGTTMSEVVQSISQVAQMLTETAANSREQSDGVAQVGTAVAQMDRETQHDAVLVANGAKAAHDLQAQAHQLVDAVAVFQLGDVDEYTGEYDDDHGEVQASSRRVNHAPQELRSARRAAPNLPAVPPSRPASQQVMSEIRERRQQASPMRLRAAAAARSSVHPYAPPQPEPYAESEERYIPTRLRRA